MSEERPAAGAVCHQCGAEILRAAPEGLCPKCLVGMGLSIISTQSGNRNEEQPDPSAPPLKQPRIFGDYELLDEIARGGMGIVYRARQISLNRTVAVKVLLFGRFASDMFVKRFRAEAEAAASLQHPNIVTVHEVGEHEGQHYFSMELVEGRSLAECVREKPLPPGEAARVVKAIAEAIEFAHRHGVLHRDLKPSNVLIDATGQPRVTDFGLAKRLTSDSDLTVSGQLLGSPNYMPPEQAEPRRGAVNAASDVYSLGAILYHLLTGRPPFLAEALEQTLSQLLHCEPVAPRLLNAAIPRDLETICLKCLEKEPARRYAAAGQLADELGCFLRDKPILARPAGPPEKLWRWCRRQPMLATLTGGLMLALATGGAGVIWQARRANLEAHGARAAAATAREQLWASELARAHLARLSAEAGRREASLRSVRAAAAIRPAPELRSEAAAALALTDLEFIPTTNLAPNTAIIFSPSLRWIVRQDEDGVSRVRRSETGERIASLRSPHGKAIRNEFSTDERWLGTEYADDALVIREWATNRVVFEWHQPVRTFAFLPRSDEVLIQGEDQQLTLISLPTAQPRWQHLMDLHLWQLRPSPDGKWFAVLSANSTVVQIHSLTNGSMVAKLTHPPSATANSVAWSADTARVAVGLANGAVALWETGTWTLQSQWQAHEDSVMRIGFDPRSRWMAIMGLEGTCRLWSLPDLKPVVSSRGYDNLGQASFDRDGSRIAWGVSNRVAGVFSILPSEVLRRILLPRSRGGSYGGLEVSPDGALLAVSSSEGASLLRFEDSTTLWEGRSPLCFSVHFAPDGSRLFIAQEGELIELPIVNTDGDAGRTRIGPPKTMGRPNLPNYQFRSGSLARDGQWLAVANISAGRVELYATAGPPNHFSIGPHRAVSQVALNSNGTWLVSSGGYEVSVWDLVSLRRLRTFSEDGPAVVCLSPDDRLLVIGGKSFRVLETQTWHELYRVQNRDHRVSGAAFSRDGKILALVVERKRIQLLDALTGRELCGLEAPDSAGLAGLAFSPQGDFLTAIESTHAVQVWNLARLRTKLAQMGLDWE